MCVLSLADQRPDPRKSGGKVWGLLCNFVNGTKMCAPPMRLQDVVIFDLLCDSCMLINIPECEWRMRKYKEWLVKLS